jgi:hypothetical protein
MAKIDDTPVDERGALEVITQGDFKSLKLRHGSELVEDFGHFGLPMADAITTPLAFINGSGEAERSKKALGQRLGLHQDWHEARRSRALAKKLDHLKNHKWHRLGGAAASTTGAFLGMSAGSALAGSAILLSWLGGPVTGLPTTLLIGGSIVGGLVAGYAYNKIVKSKDQDCVELVAQIYEAQGKTPVQPGMVFAALATKMQGQVGKDMENDLKELTKTRFFAEAAADQKFEALNQLMYKYDKQIRLASGMPIDLNNPDKTASEQFADLINTGRLDARELVLNRSRMAVVAELERQKSQSMPQYTSAIPTSPEVQTLAQNMTRLGISPVGTDVAQDLPNPEGRNHSKA